MHKIVNLLTLIIILCYFFFIIKFYSSNNNIKNINSNRVNIDYFIKNKILDIPILLNDTNDVISFNSSFSEEIKDDKPRSFWKLLKFK